MSLKEKLMWILFPHILFESLTSRSKPDCDSFPMMSFRDEHPGDLYKNQEQGPPVHRIIKYSR